MQTVSGNFTTASRATGRRPRSYVEVSWDNSAAFSGARGSSGWTNETDYLISHSGTLRINPPGESLVAAGDVGRAAVTLDNSGGRYTWTDSGGTLYADIGGAAGLIGKKLRIWQGFVLADESVEYVCIFSGFIGDWRPGVQVVLECQDRGWRLKQDKRATAVSQDMRPDEWIAYVMGLAGFTSSHWNLDVGIYQIPWLWMDDEGIAEEVWDTAQADAGLAWFDQTGILRFENALAWASKSSVISLEQNEYTSAVPRFNKDALATGVTVEWAGRTAGADTELYVLDQAKLISAGETISWVARYQYAALAVRTPDPNDPYNDYAAVSFGGVNLTADLTVSLSNSYGQQCTISVTNNGSQTAQLTYFQLRGQPLIGGPTEQSEVAADPAPLDWPRVRSVRGNPYVQTIQQGQSMAQLLALQSDRIRATWQLNGVPGLPQLELADALTFSERRHGTINGILTGISWQWGLNGFVQSLSVWDDTDLLEYAGEYYIIGTDQLGSGKRVFY